MELDNKEPTPGALPPADSLAGNNESPEQLMAKLHVRVETALEEVADTKNLIILGFFVLLFMVATLVIDSFHINSATYTEYSTKLEQSIQTASSTEMLLRENIQYKQQIVQQQTQIIELLKAQK